MASPEKFEPVLVECEALVRSGQGQKARKILEKLTAREIPSISLAQTCALLRRCGLYEMSLRFLHSRVYPKVDGQKRSATARETVEYVLALQFAGAFKESGRLLTTLAGESEPRIALAQAAQHIFHWDYALALPHYKRLTESSGITDYEKLIARVNYLSCLGYSQHPGFTGEYTDLHRRLKKENLKLLLGNVYEIAAQYFIIGGDYKEADRTLKSAESELIEDGFFGHFFAAKWRAILSALKDNSTKPLIDFRQQALKISHWETLRHLDFYQTRLNPDGEWAPWVYFGTRYQSFREKIEVYRQFPDEQYVSRSGAGRGRHIDPWFIGNRKKDSDIQHRFFVFLLSDFYRPFSIGEVADAMFGEGQFRLEGSANRVHKLVHRLRQWLTENDLPFTLQEKNGYSLRFKADLEVKARKRSVRLDRIGFIFERYRNEMPVLVRADEWALKLGVSQAKAGALLTQAREEGVLVAEGAARYTRYRFK